MQSHEFEFEGSRVHYIEAGAGAPLLLLHGSGPGASTIGNWRTVLEPLAARYHVFGMDLIGFGQSGRRARTPYFDVGFWVAQAQAMLARIPGAGVNVVGHSLAGALALKLAGLEPRVARLITTGTMGAPMPVNAGTERCWTFPESRDDLIATAEILIHDRRHISAAYLDNRVKTLFGDAAYRDYFSTMFAGDKQRYVDETVLSAAELARVTVPMAMLHGREDSAFPPSGTLALAAALRQADVTLIANCSHSIALEFPDKLLAACHGLFGE